MGIAVRRLLESITLEVHALFFDSACKGRGGDSCLQREGRVLCADGSHMAFREQALGRQVMGKEMMSQSFTCRRREPGA